MDQEALDYDVAPDDQPQTDQEMQQEAGQDEAAAGEDSKEASAAAATDADVGGGGGGGAVTEAAAAGGADPMSMPPHGTEVFLSKLPREATDEQVQAFCEQLGHKVHSIRLPKDPGSPGQNKGYAFVLYLTKEGTAEVLTKLNQAELTDFPGRKVTIVKSDVKNKLFIGNLPKTLSRDQIFEAIKAEVVGALDLSVMVERDATSGNRGFGFLEFYNNATAEAARKKLSRPEYRLHESQAYPLTVTWAEPKRSDTAAEQVKSVHIGNVPDTADEQKLRSIFSAYGKITAVVLKFSKDVTDPSKVRNFAFVHYEERASALKAVEEAADGTKYEIDGQELLVAMARPPPQRDDPDSRYGRGAPYRTPYPSAYPPPGPAAPRGSGPGGYASRAGGYGGGGPRDAGRPGPRGRGYDDGYGDGGYADDGYGEDYDQGFGAYGGFGGMAMVPVMLPNGQMAFAMAPGGGMPAAMPGGRHPPEPPPPPPPGASGGPQRRRDEGRGAGGGAESRGAAYGGGGGGAASGGAHARGAAYGAPAGGAGSRGAAYAGGGGGSGSRDYPDADRRDRDRDDGRDVRDRDRDRDGRGRDSRSAYDSRASSYGSRGSRYAPY